MVKPDREDSHRLLTMKLKNFGLSFQTVMQLLFKLTDTNSNFLTTKRYNDHPRSFFYSVGNLARLPC